MRVLPAVTAALFIVVPFIGSAQTAAPGPVRLAAIQSLHDSQWVRLAGAHLNRSEGRLLSYDGTELTLSPEPRPLRIAATSVDTIWTRGRSTGAGAVVGALLGLGFGAIFAGSMGEADVDPSALWAVSLAGSAVGGGLVGGLIGTAIPRWKRHYP